MFSRGRSRDCTEKKSRGSTPVSIIVIEDICSGPRGVVLLLVFCIVFVKKL